MTPIRICNFPKTRALILGLACVLMSSMVNAGVPLKPVDKPVIVVLGDSLSAGYGLRTEQGWVSLLQHWLDDHGYAYTVVNAGISGDTTSGGLSRLPPLLQRHQPDIVILELGINDGLRGTPVPYIQKNLQTMIDQCLAANARILLAGTLLPPNYAVFYTVEYAAMFNTLSSKNNIPLVPFLLKDVALKDNLMQDDRLHPNAHAQPIILNNVLNVLRPMLRKPKP